MKQATYRIIKFNCKSGDRFVGLAWNYEEAVLISTREFPSYREARQALTKNSQELGVSLRWYDGVYKYDNASGQIITE